MSKKILSVLLAVALLLSVIAVPAAAAGTKFSDTSNHWAKNVIDQWSGYEVVKGDGNGRFRPDAPMLRSEFATAMVNLLGLTEKTNYKVFTDVKGTEWYADSLLKLHKAGIMKGDESKRATPGSRISREEAFVMLGRALGIEPAPAADLAGYADAGKVSRWAAPMLTTMVSEGYIKGVNASELKSYANINRASVMQVMANTVTTYVTEPGNYKTSGKGFTIVKSEDAKVTVTGDSAGILVSQSSQGAEITVGSGVVAGTVKVDAPDVTIIVKDAKIENVEVTGLADSATVKVEAGATVETVTTNAEDVSVEGKGEVGAVEVNDGGNVKVTTPDTEVTVADSVKGTVSVDGKNVEAGGTATTEGTPDGYKKDEDEKPADEEGIDPGSISGDVTPKVTLTFNVNYDGGANKTVSVNKNATTVTPPTVTRTGYKLVGWYTDDECIEAAEFEEMEPITEAATYYAKWAWAPDFSVKDLSTGEEYSTVIRAFKNTYYNAAPGTFDHGTEVTPAGDKWYFTIPFAVTPTDTELSGYEVTSVTLNSTALPAAADAISVSVGNNRFAKGRAYELTTAGLKIAFPIVVLETPNSSRELVFTLASELEGYTSVTAKIKVPAMHSGLSVASVTPRSATPKFTVSKVSNTEYSIEKAENITAALTYGNDARYNINLTAPDHVLNPNIPMSESEKTIYLRKSFYTFPDNSTSAWTYGITTCTTGDADGVFDTYFYPTTYNYSITYQICTADRYGPAQVKVNYSQNLGKDTTPTP